MNLLTLTGLNGLPSRNEPSLWRCINPFLVSFSFAWLLNLNGLSVLRSGLYFCLPFWPKPGGGDGDVVKFLLERRWRLDGLCRRYCPITLSGRIVGSLLLLLAWADVGGLEGKLVIFSASWAKNWFENIPRLRLLWRFLRLRGGTTT